MTTRGKLTEAQKKRPLRKGWGDFVDGKLETIMVDTGFGGWGNCYVDVPAIFRTRADALRQFQDVRPVYISGAAS